MERSSHPAGRGVPGISDGQAGGRGGSGPGASAGRGGGRMEGARVHLVGIGGDGMVPLAELLWELGAEVTGSDLAEGQGIRELRNRGIPVRLGHREENVMGADTVVFSSAVPPDNPELSRARLSGAELIPRLSALARLLSNKRLIAVCGTHGKTTTAAWIAHLLCPWDVGFYVGARIRAPT
ncbi:hypothetical protein DRJ58_00620 [Candidatus Acetothermia bacterium]|nr:MAG: hypothetical protein DRJ58_00620 [Candidatus Acetothermia bacterium]